MKKLYHKEASNFQNSLNLEFIVKAMIIYVLFFIIDSPVVSADVRSKNHCTLPKKNSDLLV